MLPVQLVAEVEDLLKEGCQIDLFEAEGWACIVFHDYPLPPSYSRDRTRLLLKFPMSYPEGRPDMFWTEKDVLAEDGRVPRNSDTIEGFGGAEWRRFSWHPQRWNPVADNLHTYLEFVNHGLITAVS
jgi:hypothetical protein